MMRFGGVLCALSMLAQAAVAADFELVWDVAKYGGIVAAPGDTVCWKYSHH